MRAARGGVQWHRQFWDVQRRHRVGCGYFGSGAVDSTESGKRFGFRSLLLASQAALFSPSLASAPNDWSMPLDLAPAGAKAAADHGAWRSSDSSGHVWVTNEANADRGGSTVTALNNDGTLFGNFAPTGANFNNPYGVAIDSSGHVWVANNANDTGHTITALNDDGGLFGELPHPGRTLTDHMASRLIARAMSG